MANTRGIHATNQKNNKQKKGGLPGGRRWAEGRGAKQDIVRKGEERGQIVGGG